MALIEGTELRDGLDLHVIGYQRFIPVGARATSPSIPIDSFRGKLRRTGTIRDNKISKTPLRVISYSIIVEGA